MIGKGFLIRFYGNRIDGEILFLRFIMNDDSIHQRDFLPDGFFDFFAQLMGLREFLDAEDEMGVNKDIAPRVPGLDGFDFFDLLEAEDHFPDSL